MKKNMLLILLLTTLLSLNAINRIKLLGNSFNLLIPDIEQDTKNFPDRLHMYKQKQLVVGTNNYHSKSTDISITPILGNIANRTDLAFLAYDYNTVNAEKVETRQYEQFRINNYLYLKNGKNNWGIVTELSIDQSIVDSAANTPEYYTYWSEADRYSRLSENIDKDNYVKLGLSTSLASDPSWSIALNNIGYFQNDKTKSTQSNETVENDTLIYSRLTNGNRDYDIVDGKIQFQLIKDFGYNNESRFLLQLEYAEVREDYINNYNYYTYNPLGSASEIFFQDSETERSTSKLYSLALGLGSSMKHTNYNVYYAGRLDCQYVTNDYYLGYYEKSEKTVIDSMITEEIRFSNTFDVEECTVELTIPIGVSFKFSKSIEAFASVAVNGGYHKYFSQSSLFNNTSKWFSESSQQFGIIITPSKNFYCNINKLNSLTNFNTLKLQVGYLF